jgi:FkbM family methyltransferase
MNDLIDTPKQNDLVFDIGMHKGEDTEFYLKKGFRVVAIEADPDLASLCRKGLKKFIDNGQLTIIEGAIVNLNSVEAGQETVTFFRNDNVSVWGTVCADWKERNERLGTSSSTLKVDVIDFASLMQQHGVPHFMKIDVEGVDMVCVYALRLFRERPNYVSIESDKTSFANIRHEIDLLAELGYDAFQAVEQSTIPHSQSPPNPAREGNYVAQCFKYGASGLFGSELGCEWKSKHNILRQYRYIRLGYYLLGDDGIVKQWKFRGARRLLSLISRLLYLFTKAKVPGWYDTHARHSCVDDDKG